MCIRKKKIHLLQKMNELYLVTIKKKIAQQMMMDDLKLEFLLYFKC